jgi:hypothetical protein
MKRDELLDAMAAEGYTNQWPNVNPNALVYGASIDQEVAESVPCPECHGKCEYKPFVDNSGHSYRAFSVCTVCGEAYEF